MGRPKINLGLIPTNETLTGQVGGNLLYVSNPVSQSQNLGSDVDKENPENQMKAMDARSEQNAKKIMSLNAQERDASGDNNTNARYEGINPYFSAETEPNTAQNPIIFPTTEPNTAPIIGGTMGEQDLKTVVGNSIDDIDKGGDINPVTGEKRSALGKIIDDAKSQRAKVDADYQKQLNRQRMFQALYKGLSALSQIPGAVSNGNAALKEDNTMFNAMETELGKRWQQNRSDIQNDMTRSIEDLRNAQSMDKWKREQDRLDAKQKTDEEKLRLNAKKVDGQIEHWNNLDEVAKSKMSKTQLESELVQAKIAVEVATKRMREATTDKAYSDAQAAMIRANAYAANVQDEIDNRNGDKVVKTEKSKTDPITGMEAKETTVQTTSKGGNSGTKKFTFGKETEKEIKKFTF